MKKGFTLVELVVVVGVVGLVMSSVVAILINTTRAKTRLELTSKVESSGNLIVNEIKNNMYNAVGVGLTCLTSTTDRISFVNATDGAVTTIRCYEGLRIASESAMGSFDLSSQDVSVSGCTGFVSCDFFDGTTDNASKVKFAFGVVAGSVVEGGERYVNRLFKVDVSTRN